MIIRDARRVVHDEGPRPAHAGDPLKAFGLLSILSGEAHTTAYTGESHDVHGLHHQARARRDGQKTRDKGWGQRVR